MSVDIIKASTPIALASVAGVLSVAAMCLKLSDAKFGSVMTLASVLAGAGSGIATQTNSRKIEADTISNIESK